MPSDNKIDDKPNQQNRKPKKKNTKSKQKAKAIEKRNEMKRNNAKRICVRLVVF